VVTTGADGLIAAFGSATDAVRTAVGMQQHFTRSFPELLLRVGIASGDVSWADDDCFGIPVILAALLQARAAGGEIVVSALVRLLDGNRARATFRALGTFELTGIDGPVDAFDVEWNPSGTIPESSRLAIPLPGAVAAPPPFRFVGRSAEWEHLAGAWNAASSGHRRIVLIGGEAGTGKTRLAFEFARSCAADRVPVVLGVCDVELVSPLQPWVQILIQVVRAVPPEVLTALSDEISDLAVLSPQLERLLPGVRTQSTADAQTERHRLFQAVTTLLAAVTVDHPMVLIIDDLHWADAQTLSLLRHVARANDPTKLLVVVTFRDTGDEITDPLAGCLADLLRLDIVSRVRLQGLDDSTISLFVEGVVGHPLDEGLRAVAGALAARSGGNAFFVTELWRHVVSSGSIVVVNGRWRARDGVAASSEVPESVREVVAHRATRLSSESKGLLSLAAVAGLRIEFSVLALASGLEARVVGLALDELVHAKFIVEIGEQGQPVYAFAHAIVRESVERTVASARRATLHLKLARAIETVHGADLRPLVADLARHYVASAHLGVREQALGYNRLAAQEAARTGAYDGAVTHLNAALRFAEPDSVEAIEILLELGAARTRGGYVPDPSDDLSQAFVMASRTGRTAHAVQAAAGISDSLALWGIRSEHAAEVCRAALALTDADDNPTRIRLQASLGRALALLGTDHDEAFRLVNDAVDAARRLGDDELALHALNCRLQTHNLSPHDELRDSTEFGALAWKVGDLYRYCWARLTYVRISLTFGWVADSTRATRELAEIATRERFATLATWAAYNEVILSFIAGRFDEADRRCQDIQRRHHDVGIDGTDGVYGLQMFAIRREQDRLGEVAPIVRLAASLNPDEPVWRPGLALLCVELGMLDDARREFVTMSRDGFAAIPRDSMWPCCLTFLAEVCIALGDTAQAEVLYRELGTFRGLTMMAAFTMNFGPAEQLMGGLAALVGRTDAAEQHFAAALELAERSGSPLWTARVHYAWAVALGDSDGRLAAAHATATRLGMPALARRCAEAAVHATPHAFPAGLSAREVDVLRLVAAGRSNREIGEALFISRNTVANHVRAILQKTMCANRADAAAYATRQGIAAAHI
jgi:DNA-binding CsgD family transcriptional regulator/tetratricopeptide (TPR) repeat protein